MAKKKIEKIKRIRLADEAVIVNSKAYGKHERAPRFTHTPRTESASLKKFSDMNTRANGIAKTINDVFKPFKQGVKDGTMWSRLVGAVKKSLHANPQLDLGFLREFHFRAKFGFSRFYQVTASATINDSTLKVEIQSAPATSIRKYKASHFEQILVIVFLDRDLRTVTNTHSRIFPVVSTALPKKRNIDQQYTFETMNDVASFDIPPDTTHILVALKCAPLKGGVCDNPAASPFGVFEVLEKTVVDEGAG